MLYSTTTPAAKRKALRAGLASGGLLRFPGAFNPLSARLVQRKGFEGVYVSGAVLSADLGLPDIGLTTLPEVAGRAAEVARQTDLPVLVDADTGFGEPLNLARTVQALEDAGVAAFHVEDQVNPKRCGHLEGKSVVDDAAAVRRVKAAVDARRDGDLVVVARTDVRGTIPGPEGLRAAVERSRMLVDAGADVLFPEAMADLAEFEAVCSAVDVPVLANVTEFGRSDLFTHEQLRDAGVRLVIHPVSLLRLAMGAADRALDALAAEGTLAGRIGQMQTRAQLYDLLDYASYGEFDSGVHDFSLEGNRDG
ncbi:methylisocitrate lyase [Paenibacillus sp. TRM 82003]|uniref:methylisocitrate lyase n=1 Tax=Kineococcus sp. TRM81007 TaxID=2925831 RepID=UPI001F591D1A|nr:methylisocitrate lyase [Kineococcus sp. TRM81007]MCI2239993.1 methylisocitrate lyase [Kineococcus sp. TRM81007]MCI3925702.1 methylisocitrate lyase [Paenibacillus sp. TRM 82003]